MARDEEEGMLLAPCVALQVTRQGLDRATSAAVLAPFHGREESNEAEGEGGRAKQTSTRWHLTIFQVPENDQLSCLDSMLVQTGPAHAYFPCEPSSKKKETGGSKAEKGDQRKLQHILERQGIDASPLPQKGSAFRPPPEDFESNLLPRLLTPQSRDLLQYKKELDYTQAMACVHALVTALDLRDEEVSIHLSLGSLDQFMRLDSSAAEAINLFPPERGEQRWVENGSLYQILNKCRTKM
ncbi:dna mismatch repair protein msh2, partial [Nannochloropsis gaditana CCMP526]|uniref:dna mismatch repair protein msh2 n=1 Tax=Nannochloropsis gaditana (strain CCMP526) TaxID=1093141 RepID=UPI00029F4E97